MKGSEDHRRTSVQAGIRDKKQKYGGKREGRTVWKNFEGRVERKRENGPIKTMKKFTSREG